MARTTPARAVDVEALFPELAAYRRQATRLHPRRGKPGIHDSSVGGPLLWPADEPWPHCSQAHPNLGFEPPPPGPVPLVPVLQLYASDVLDLPFPSRTNLLQLLWCPYDHEPHYVPRPELRWRAADSNGPLLADPPRPTGAPESYMPAPCVLHPERIVEYPQWDLPQQLNETLGERFERLEDETGWSYWYDLSIAPGIKIGGYPGWTQEPDWPDCDGCGKRMDHLLTIDSTEFDGGTARAWLPVEDRPASGTIIDLPYEERHAIQCCGRDDRRHGRRLRFHLPALSRSALHLSLGLLVESDRKGSCQWKSFDPRRPGRTLAAIVIRAARLAAILLRIA
jgi:hypothetical protein